MMVSEFRVTTDSEKREIGEMSGKILSGKIAPKLGNQLCMAWCSGNAFGSINEVTVLRARLVLRLVTACGQVNYLGMKPAA